MCCLIFRVKNCSWHLWLPKRERLISAMDWKFALATDKKTYRYLFVHVLLVSFSVYISMTCCSISVFVSLSVLGFIRLSLPLYSYLLSISISAHRSILLSLSLSYSSVFLPLLSTQIYPVIVVTTNAPKFCSPLYLGPDSPVCLDLWSVPSVRVPAVRVILLSICIQNYPSMSLFLWSYSSVCLLLTLCAHFHPPLSLTHTVCGFNHFSLSFSLWLFSLSFSVLIPFLVSIIPSLPPLSLSLPIIASLSFCPSRLFSLSRSHYFVFLSSSAPQLFSLSLCTPSLSFSLAHK